MRKVGSALAVVVLAISLGGCWLQPDFDAGRTRWAPGETTITPANAGDLVKLWDTQLPDGASYLLQPISDGGAIYVTGATPTGAIVAALDAGSGQLRWSRQLTDPDWRVQAGAPASFDGRIVVPYQVLTSPRARPDRVDVPDGDARGGRLRRGPRHRR